LELKKMTLIVQNCAQNDGNTKLKIGLNWILSTESLDSNLSI